MEALNIDLEQEDMDIIASCDGNARVYNPKDWESFQKVPLFD